MSDSTSLDYDREYTLRANNYFKTGSSFLGWALTPDGDVAFTDRAVVKNLTDENGAVVTLYAVWGDKRITVVFNANGGKFEGMDRYEARKKIVEDLPRVMEQYKIENLNDIIGGAHRG